MMPIDIQFIPHDDQRYDTVGDWWTDINGLHIRVSCMGHTRYEFLVALHELIEAFSCLWAKIDEQAVTDFDLKFEEERGMGLHSDEAEPGDDKNAPYRRQHQFATLVERMTAYFLSVNWDHYEEIINKLSWRGN